MRCCAGVLVAVAMLAGAYPPAGVAGKAGVALPRPGVLDLMTLRGHDHALIRVARGRHVPGGTLVSRRLGIWRVPARVANRVALGLHLLALEPDRELVPQRALVEPLAGLEWWRGAVGADRVTPPPAGKLVTVIDTGLDVTHPEFAGRPGTTPLNQQSTLQGAEEEHGTAVSSVVAAPENGIGLIGIYPQAALAEWDSGRLLVSDVIAGIEHSLDAGPGVINMSFGFNGYDRMLADEIDVAFGSGSLVPGDAGQQQQDQRYPAEEFRRYEADESPAHERPDDRRRQKRQRHPQLFQAYGPLADEDREADRVDCQQVCRDADPKRLRAKAASNEEHDDRWAGDAGRCPEYAASESGEGDGRTRFGPRRGNAGHQHHGEGDDDTPGDQLDRRRIQRSQQLRADHKSDDGARQQRQDGAPLDVRCGANRTIQFVTSVSTMLSVTTTGGSYMWSSGVTTTSAKPNPASPETPPAMNTTSSAARKVGSITLFRAPCDAHLPEGTHSSFVTAPGGLTDSTNCRTRSNSS